MGALSYIVICVVISEIYFKEDHRVFLLAALLKLVDLFRDLLMALAYASKRIAAATLPTIMSHGIQPLILYLSMKIYDDVNKSMFFCLTYSILVLLICESINRVLKNFCWRLSQNSYHDMFIWVRKLSPTSISSIIAAGIAYLPTVILGHFNFIEEAVISYYILALSNPIVIVMSSLMQGFISGSKNDNFSNFSNQMILMLRKGILICVPYLLILFVVFDKVLVVMFDFSLLLTFVSKLLILIYLFLQIFLWTFHAQLIVSEKYLGNLFSITVNLFILCILLLFGLGFFKFDAIQVLGFSLCFGAAFEVVIKLSTIFRDQISFKLLRAKIKIQIDRYFDS
jgi:hypothetical protein